MAKKSKRKVDLKALFKDLQGELAARLGTTRRNVFHPGAKGEATEADWRGLLENYLPRRYWVSKGFVVDYEGNVSDEIDLIVHDRQYSPLLFHHQETRYVPAESVYAVFEVKPELNASYVDYGGKKAASVRRLKRSSAVIPHAGGKHSPKNPCRILAGILATSCSWKNPTGKPLKANLKKLKTQQQLDLGCVASGPGFVVTYDKAGASITSSKQDTGLVFFFMRLLELLQAQGTVPAMDYSEYYSRALS